MRLKLHWRILHGGDSVGLTRLTGDTAAEGGLPALSAQIPFCKVAERCGIDGLLVDVGADKPDPILLSAALLSETEKIEMIIAFRSAFQSPTLFVQQLDTLSTICDGRFSLNIVAGHSPSEQRYYGDFLSHAERYARTEEFLAVCNALWRGDDPVRFTGKYYTIEGPAPRARFVSSRRTSPEIFIAGGSEEAREVAIRQGTCWMLLAEAPDQLKSKIGPVLRAGKEVGLRLGIISRPTREEALQAAHDMVHGLDPRRGERAAEAAFVRASDSASVRATFDQAGADWWTPTLWAGAVRTHGSAAIALVGSPDEVASALMEYKKIGVSQFILAGWPKQEQMVFFGEQILPRVRDLERRAGDGEAP